MPCVQLRQDNALGTLWNMVGFQTKLKHGEQVRIFRTIPGLENAEFARLGGIHRNSFINSPKLLDRELRLKSKPNIRFAGQITGCEGYVESAAIGLLAARFAAAEIAGATLAPPPPETALGALLDHITGGAEAETYQPMNVNFGLMPPIDRTEDAERPTARRCYTDRRARGRRCRGMAEPRREPPQARLAASTHAFFFGGGGAVVAYSAGVSQPERSLSAPREFVDRLHRPFLEAQRAVAVGVELGEGLAPRLEQFGGGDPPVVVLVGAGEALLLAVLGVAAGASGRVGGTTVDGVATRGGGAGGSAAASSALPCQSRNAPVSSRKAGRSPGKKARHGTSLNKEIRRGETMLRNGADCQSAAG